MEISVFELFSKGIGPSSSHTVGPMRAMGLFLDKIEQNRLFGKVSRIRIDLYGSLASTGKGHGTDKAVILGLLGENPETIDTDKIESAINYCRKYSTINLAQKKTIAFEEDLDIVFHLEPTDHLYANTLEARAFGKDSIELIQDCYYSIGGGFVLAKDDNNSNEEDIELSMPFASGAELLQQCQSNDMTISEIMLANELSWNSEIEIQQRLVDIWQTMDACIEKGIRSDGILPGRLKVQRRAHKIYKKLNLRSNDPLIALDYVTLYALAVNEENAAGGRVVTAPTNGAAGIIPAVIKYFVTFHNGCDDDVVRFLLTAAAIGILFKKNASISGAEVGCQGEVGSACSMAAAGLCEVLGGTYLQVENAAEIAMEHNLGLTCDPIEGLVQIPCIERNAMGAIKAINAARMALNEDGVHQVSLDKVINTMRLTGQDMNKKYKETSGGGLAVNIIEC